MLASGDFGGELVCAAEWFPVEPRLGFHSFGERECCFAGFLHFEFCAGEDVDEADVATDACGLSDVGGGEIAIHAGRQNFPARAVARAENVVGPFLFKIRLDDFIDAVLLHAMRAGEQTPSAGDAGFCRVERPGLAQLGEEAVEVQLLVLGEAGD